MSEMKLVFEENFDTDFEEGNWKNSPYAERFYPLNDFCGSPVSPNGTKADRDTELVDKNISVKDGTLILKAKGKNDKTYTGCEIRSKEFFTYGYYEIKAKVQSSKGICPAFWLLGSRDSASKIEYEIDVFECFGRIPNILKNTLLAHSYPNGSTGEYAGTEYRFNYNCLIEEQYPKNDLIKVSDEFKNTYFEGNWGEEFHTYGLEWKPDSIIWYIDRKPMLISKPSEVFDGKYIYNEPMQIILTCYSGRDVCTPMTSFPDETTDWENGSSLEVEYVRVYQSEK